MYYEDTDSGGVVYYANYLKFFERCRSEWLRALGLDNRTLLEQHGVLLVVAHCSTDYRKPARLDEALTVTASVERWGTASVVFAQQVLRGEGDRAELCTRAQVKVACVGANSLRPQPWPEAVRQKFDQFNQSNR